MRPTSLLERQVKITPTSLKKVVNKESGEYKNTGPSTSGKQPQKSPSIKLNFFQQKIKETTNS